MNTSRQLAYDTPDSSVIQAIYSKRGVEILSYSGYMYKFDVSDQKINFLAFDDIASVVFDKFNNLLNESTYKITRAKLYERVFLNEAQQMEVSPVWYFEILQDDDTTSITLVGCCFGGRNISRIGKAGEKVELQKQRFTHKSDLSRLLKCYKNICGNYRSKYCNIIFYRTDRIDQWKYFGYIYSGIRAFGNHDCICVLCISICYCIL